MEFEINLKIPERRTIRCLSGQIQKVNLGTEKKYGGGDFVQNKRNEDGSNKLL